MRFLILLLVTFHLLSCSDTTRDEALDWYDQSENGYTQTKNIGGLQYVLKYQPSEYTLLDNLEKRTYTETELQALKEKFGEGGYFKMRISAEPTDNNALQRIQGLTNYYIEHSFDPSKFSLVTPTDTLIATFFHSERAYELSKRVSILVGFDEKIEPNQIYKFIYKDDLINQSGLIFQFDLEAGPDCSDNIDCINRYRE